MAFQNNRYRNYNSNQKFVRRTDFCQRNNNISDENNNNVYSPVKKHPPVNLRWLYKDLNEFNAELKLKIKDLSADCKNNYSLVQDFRTIGSYNWSVDSTRSLPLIIVPGKSKHLNDSFIPRELKREERWEYIDKNQYYMPDYPMEPIFRSVMECTPDFQFKDIDFITDR